MKILSHRGYWVTELEKNTKLAFLRSFELGFGTETDIRDSSGNLVISHDPASGSEMLLRDFLLLCPDDITIALNIKADGLARLVRDVLLPYKKIDWFVFDMAIPDMRDHLAIQNPVFCRMSEVESYPPWLEKCDGVWLDAFDELWFDTNLIDSLLERGKKICIVSPELHKRDHLPLWNMLNNKNGYKKNRNLFLCTDWSEKAQLFFGGASND
jgi:glycerophosphoryl diester phosphodiesterase